MLAIGTPEPRGLFARLAAWWRERRRSRELVGELDQDGVDAEQIARDVGISPADLRVIAARRPDAADLLRPRLVALGISPEFLARGSPEVLRDLERVCSLCGSKRRCRHDLAEHPTDPGWRAYCPNVQTIDAIRQQAGAAKRVDEDDQADCPCPALYHCFPGQY